MQFDTTEHILAGQAQKLDPEESGQSPLRVTFVNFTGDRPNWGCQATSWELVKLWNRALRRERQSLIDFVPLLPLHQMDQEMSTRFGAEIRLALMTRSPTTAQRDLLLEVASKRYQGLLSRVEQADVIVFQAEGTMTGTDFLRAERLLLLPFLAKIAWGKPVLSLNQSFFSADVGFNAVIRNVFATFDAIAVREPSSLVFAHSLGLEDAILVPDAAFWTQPLPGPGHQDMHDDVDYFCVTGSSAFAHQVPIKQFLDLVKAIQDQFGITPVFAGSTGLDKQLAEKARIQFDNPHLIGVRPETDYRLVTNILARCRFLLGGRFHMAILAASAGTPSILLPANTYKNEGLAELIRHPFGVRLPDDRSRILSDAHEILSQHSRWKEEIQQTVGHLRARISAGEAWIRNLLIKRGLVSGAPESARTNAETLAELRWPVSERQAGTSPERLDYYKQLVVAQKKAFSYPSAPGIDRILGTAMNFQIILRSIIVAIRRGLASEEHFQLLDQLIRSHTDSICSQLNTRWLTSICDTYADFGDEVERRNAMLISLFVNLEKVSQSYVMWRLNYPVSFEVPEQHEHRKIYLWDGMTSFHVDIGDVTNSMFQRLDILLRSTPHLHKILRRILQTMDSKETILGTLNRRHNHVFDTDYSWIMEERYAPWRESGEVPIHKYAIFLPQDESK